MSRRSNPSNSSDTFSVIGFRQSALAKSTAWLMAGSIASLSGVKPALAEEDSLALLSMPAITSLAPGASTAGEPPNPAVAAYGGVMYENLYNKQKTGLAFTLIDGMDFAKRNQTATADDILNNLRDGAKSYEVLVGLANGNPVSTPELDKAKQYFGAATGIAAGGIVNLLDLIKGGDSEKSKWARGQLKNAVTTGSGIAIQSAWDQWYQNQKAPVQNQAEMGAVSRLAFMNGQDPALYRKIFGQLYQQAQKDSRFQDALDKFVAGQLGINLQTGWDINKILASNPILQQDSQLKALFEKLNNPNPTPSSQPTDQAFTKEDAKELEDSLIAKFKEEFSKAQDEAARRQSRQSMRELGTLFDVCAQAAALGPNPGFAQDLAMLGGAAQGAASYMEMIDRGGSLAVAGGYIGMAVLGVQLIQHFANPSQRSSSAAAFEAIGKMFEELRKQLVDLRKEQRAYYLALDYKIDDLIDRSIKTTSELRSLIGDVKLTVDQVDHKVGLALEKLDELSQQAINSRKQMAKWFTDFDAKNSFQNPRLAVEMKVLPQPEWEKAIADAATLAAPISFQSYALGKGDKDSGYNFQDCELVRSRLAGPLETLINLDFLREKFLEIGKSVPELAGVAVPEITPRADIWAEAAALYLILVQNHPEYSSPNATVYVANLERPGKRIVNTMRAFGHMAKDKDGKPYSPLMEALFKDYADKQAKVDKALTALEQAYEAQKMHGLHLFTEPEGRNLIVPADPSHELQFKSSGGKSTFFPYQQLVAPNLSDAAAYLLQLEGKTLADVEWTRTGTWADKRPFDYEGWEHESVRRGGGGGARADGGDFHEHYDHRIRKVANVGSYGIPAVTISGSFNLKLEGQNARVLLFEHDFKDTKEALLKSKIQIVQDWNAWAENNPLPAGQVWLDTPKVPLTNYDDENDPEAIVFSDTGRESNGAKFNWPEIVGRLRLADVSPSLAIQILSADQVVRQIDSQQAKRVKLLDQVPEIVAAKLDEHRRVFLNGLSEFFLHWGESGTANFSGARDLDANALQNLSDALNELEASAAYIKAFYSTALGARGLKEHEAPYTALSDNLGAQNILSEYDQVLKVYAKWRKSFVGLSFAAPDQLSDFTEAAGLTQFFGFAPKEQSWIRQESNLFGRTPAVIESIRRITDEKSKQAVTDQSSWQDDLDRLWAIRDKQETATVSWRDELDRALAETEEMAFSDSDYCPEVGGILELLHDSKFLSKDSGGKK